MPNITTNHAITYTNTKKKISFPESALPLSSGMGSGDLWDNPFACGQAGTNKSKKLRKKIS